jgi:hypothetical protein
LLAVVPEGISVTQRVGERGQAYLFVMNALPVENHIRLETERIDLITGKALSDVVTLPPRGVLVLSDR